MKKIKAVVLILVLSIPIFLLSGCFTKTKLNKPIGDYLSKNYGIKNGEFKILSADNNWFEGIDHQTYVEINKPYHTFAYLIVDRNSHEIDKDSGDDVFLEIFKGAYVEQHSDVLKQSDKIIKKYNLLSESPNDYDKGKQNFYYYLHVNIDEHQEKELIEDFKQEQKLNTDKIIKNVKVSKPRNNANYIGVINFIYYYNTYKNSGSVPNAQSIVDDFEKSHVLTEGVYNIAVRTIYSSPASIQQGVDIRDSNVMFIVDKSGKFKVTEPNLNF
ncbi:hypothetical protein AB1283_19585 [Bacillus sp. S13(2024)]|uniref:hypothetical protein n=1 Tax=unclassified Bacillus (in: firmicutes) TaxID=185979 RepID=UPI003D1B0A9A